MRAEMPTSWLGRGGLRTGFDGLTVLPSFLVPAACLLLVCVACVMVDGCGGSWVGGSTHNGNGRVMPQGRIDRKLSGTCLGPSARAKPPGVLQSGRSIDACECEVASPRRTTLRLSRESMDKINLQSSKERSEGLQNLKKQCVPHRVAPLPRASVLTAPLSLPFEQDAVRSLRRSAAKHKEL